MHDRPTEDTPSLQHSGPCGRRERCWRSACRDAFGAYLTVEVLDDGTVIARCHGSAFRPLTLPAVA